MESRSVARYVLDLPVVFHWKDASGQRFSGTGFTRDISSAAMFVIASEMPASDVLVTCEVMLPRHPSGTSMQISARGRVLRVEHGLDLRHRGFAVCGDMLLLCSNAFGRTMSSPSSAFALEKSAN